MKTDISRLFELYKGLTPKEDEHMLDPQHSVQKHADNSGNGDEVFKASKIKQTTRKIGPDARHGYTSEQGKKVYDSHNKKLQVQKEEVDADLDESNSKIADHLIKRYGDNVRMSHCHSAAKDFGAESSKISKAVKKKLGVTILKEEENLEEMTHKVGTYSLKDGSSFALHRSEHDPKHHMLVRKKDGHVVKGYAGTSHEVHKILTGEGLSGALHESASRLSSPHFRAAQKNVQDIKDGKVAKETHKAKTWKQHLKDSDNHHKARFKHHQAAYKSTKEQHDDMYDYAKPFYEKHRAGTISHDEHGQLEELDHQIEKHSYKMAHHMDRMIHHNSMLDKPHHIKEDAEQIDELSKSTLKSYIDKTKKGTGKDFNTPLAFRKSMESQGIAAAKLGKKFKRRSLPAVKVMAKESVIDKIYDTYIADKVITVNFNEEFTKNISELSVRAQTELLALFNSLTEENKEQMVEISETREGINDLLDFALTRGK